MRESFQRGTESQLNCVDLVWAMLARLGDRLSFQVFLIFFEHLYSVHNTFRLPPPMAGEQRILGERSEIAFISGSVCAAF